MLLGIIYIYNIYFYIDSAEWVPGETATAYPYMGTRESAQGRISI